MAISKHTSFHQTTSVSGLAELGPHCPVATVCLKLEPLMTITGCCKITDAFSVLTYQYIQTETLRLRPMHYKGSGHLQASVVFQGCEDTHAPLPPLSGDLKATRLKRKAHTQQNYSSKWSYFVLFGSGSFCQFSSLHIHGCQLTVEGTILLERLSSF